MHFMQKEIVVWVRQTTIQITVPLTRRPFWRGGENNEMVLQFLQKKWKKKKKHQILIKSIEIKVYLLLLHIFLHHSPLAAVPN